MKKLALVIGIISIFSTSAYAGGIVCKPNVWGGQTCVYSPYAF